jgi:hypothetical protein
MIEASTVGAIESRIALTLRVGVPSALVAVSLWHIFGGHDPSDRFFDDFFYYLKPAKNWVAGHGSTFFPRESTNGYHPLWFSLSWLIVGGSIDLTSW